MTLNHSLSEILVNLEGRIESLGEQVALHARQEEHHREQRALLEAELEKAKGHLESFRAVAATAADLHLPAAAPPPPPPEEDLGPYPTVAKMVARVVADRPEGERFGPKLVVAEVNRRFDELQLGFVDAAIVALAEALGLRRVATTDRRQFEPLAGPFRLQLLPD